MSNDSHHDKHHEGDVAFIRSLAELLNSSELNEIQVKREYGEHDRLTVSLTKQGKQVVYAQSPAAPSAPAPQASAPAREEAGGSTATTMRSQAGAAATRVSSMALRDHRASGRSSMTSPSSSCRPSRVPP